MKKLLIIFNGLSVNDYQEINRFSAADAEILNLSDKIDDNYSFQLPFVNRQSLLSKYQDKAIEDLKNLIGEIGQKMIYKGKNIKQLLAIPTGISMWWFNALQYKFSNEYLLCSRLVFLELIKDLLQLGKYEKYLIYGGDQETLAALRQHLPDPRLCFSAAAGPVMSGEGLILLKGVFGSLFYALCMLFSILKIRLLNLFRRDLEKKPDVSFFAIYPGSLIKKGNEIKERYYGGLPSALRKKGLRINFVSILSDIGNIRNLFKLNYLKVVNQYEFNVIILESLLSLGNVASQYLDYLKIAFKFYFLPHDVKKELFVVKGRDYSLLFRKTFLSSIYGCGSYRALLLSEAAYKYAKQYKPKLLFTCYVINHVARAVNHGIRRYDHKLTILGLQHASYPRTKVETRYHKNEIDPEPGGKDQINYSPFADYEFFQGKITRDLFMTAGLPEYRSLLFGSPRFDPLFKYATMQANPNTLPSQVAESIPEDKRVLLVATGLFHRDIEQLLDVLFKSIDEECFLIFKPHPNKSIDKMLNRYTQKYPQIEYVICNNNIHELILHSDVLITSHSTAAEEAIAIGKPAISVHAGAHINISALASIGVDICASNPRELKEKIAESFTYDKDSFEKMRQYVIKQCFGAFDGKATKRISEFVFNKVCK